jgi:dienelactone hydrolase
MADVDVLKDYALFDFDDGRWVMPVFKRGAGPAVIVIHEMPGLIPEVVRFADRVAAAGMTVYLPSLFGRPGKPPTRPYTLATMIGVLCIRREFNAWAADKSSPVVDWLRALAKKAHADCGGRGVGAVGMCFTGNFALAMMTEPAMVAPVLSQPSLPIGKKKAAALGVSPSEIACAKQRFADEDLSMIALRFEGDPFVPSERFETLKATFGDKVETIELDPKDAQPFGGMAPHSVLTLHLNDGDPNGPTKKAEERVIQFFKERTAAVEAPEPA